MTGSVIDNILKERELKNEKAVALIRLLLAAAGILDFLSYFKIISLGPPITVAALWIAVFLFIYAAIVLIILLRNIYLKYLKFFVIFFDYAYVVLSFILRPELINDAATIVWFAFAGAIAFYLINLLRYSKAGTIFAGILATVVFFGVNLYFRVPPETIFSVSIALALVLIIGYTITVANRKMLVEANTKKMMERYLPPQLVGELYRKNVGLEPGGKNQEVTILFSDIRAFTTISEKMTAGEIVAVLNDYLSTMTDIIFEHQGTIDKFIGDAIMIIFGAPFKREDDALRAVRTAIAMNIALMEFNKNHEMLEQPLQIGIGIHTGEVIAGNIGSDKRLDYTVIGDNVNLSSRIAGLTRYYPCPILISQTTCAALLKAGGRDAFSLREVDNVIVKGRSERVKILEVLYSADASEKQFQERLIKDFESGLHLYRARRFHEAAEQFSKIQKDRLSELYYERCQHFIKNPPDKQWDGTFIMDKK